MSANSTLVIIGNGVTGITAAREARKIAPELSIKIISDESEYFYSRTALMYIYMGHMRPRDTEVYERSFYKKNNLQLIFDTVQNIDTDKCELKLDSNKTVHYDYLLIATGSRPNFFGWPGQDSGRVQGLYNLNDLKTLQELTDKKNNAIKKAVIVGGGLIGIELAEMLHTRNIHVQFLIRENSYWDNILPPEESKIINQEILDHKIGLHTNTQLLEIIPNKNGDAIAVQTDNAGRIDCEFVGITAGVSPNVDVVKKSKIKIKRGVLVDNYFRTSVSRVYAAGDCAQFLKPDGEPGHLEQLWYTGKMHGQVVAHQIAADFLRSTGNTNRADQIDVNAYNRGVWFNSAKFFTIEYQTYGFVPADVQSQNTHVWISKNKKKLIRLVWKNDSKGQNIITGMNAFGIRFRQQTWFDWISSGLQVHEVVDHLSQSMFDPEFFEDHIPEFKNDYFSRFKKQVEVVA